MKRALLLIISFSLVLLLSGCNNKSESNKVMKCSKKEPFNGTGIKWTNNLEIEYNGKDVITNTTIKHIFKIESDITEDNKETFLKSVYDECKVSPGVDFDLCDIKEEDDTYIVRLSTNSISLVETAISSNEEDMIPESIKIDDLKDILEIKEFECIKE